jgi:hypothetical protein
VDLVRKQSLLILRLKEKPLQIKSEDPTGLSFVRISDKFVSLAPQRVGRYWLKLLFGDPKDESKQFTITLQVHIQQEAAGKSAGKPIPTKESLARLDKAFAKGADTEIPLDLTDAEPFVLPVKETPPMLHCLDPQVLDFTVVNANAIRLEPQKVGRTSLAIWFGDRKEEAKQFVITFKVNVRPKVQ